MTRQLTASRTAAMLCFLLAVGHATGVHAVERFRPSDPQFIVLERSARSKLGARPKDVSATCSSALDSDCAARVAGKLIERARTQREARFFGRAEALLRPLLQQPDVAPELLMLQADILQNRHDFTSAIGLLNRALGARPQDPRARLLRATVHTVRGELKAARGDCSALLTAGDLTVGTLCLAQASAGMADVTRGEAMIATLLAAQRVSDASTRVWALTIAADLARRRGADANAENALREAVALAPGEESVRAALAALLNERGAWRKALAVTDLDRPSPALLLQRVIAQHRSRDPGFEKSSRRFREVVETGRLRGERAHLREEALYALEVSGSAATALPLAQANFTLQREMTDVRLLARAAVATGDRAALEQLRGWLRETGYGDRVVEAMLAGSPPTTRPSSSVTHGARLTMKDH